MQVCKSKYWMKDDSQSEGAWQVRNFQTWKWTQKYCKKHTTVFHKEKHENYVNVWLVS